MSMTLAQRRLIWEEKKRLKRERMIKHIKKIALLMALMLLAGGASFFFSNKLKADSNDVLHKYYTTIKIEANDTLWDIANDHLLGYKDANKYIEEVMFMNHLESPDQIYVGMKLSIPYYDEEIK